MSFFHYQAVTVMSLYFHFHGRHDNYRKLPKWARKITLHKLAKIVGLIQFMQPDWQKDEILRGHTTNVELLPEEDKAGTANNNESLDTDLEKGHGAPVFVYNKKGSAQDIPVVKIENEVKESETNKSQKRKSRRSLHSGTDLRQSSEDTEEMQQDKTKKKIKQTLQREHSTINVTNIAEQLEQLRRNIEKKDAKNEGDQDVIVYNIMKHAELYDERAVDSMRAHILKYEWKQVAMVTDRLFLYIYFSITLATWIYIYLQLPFTSKGMI